MVSFPSLLFKELLNATKRFLINIGPLSIAK